MKELICELCGCPCLQLYTVKNEVEVLRVCADCLENGDEQYEQQERIENEEF